MMRSSRVFYVGIAALLLLCAAPAVRSEVGATTGDPSAVTHFDVVPYILGSAIEDPEPIGQVWIRYNADGPQRRVLNAAGYANGDGAPSIVRGLDGGPIVAWSRNSPTGYDIVVSAFDGADWSAPAVASAAAGDERDPRLAVDPSDGSVHLFYWVDGPEPAVLHREAPADLSSWSDPEPVSAPGEPACRPGAAFHAGTLYVAYELHDFGAGQTPREVVLARRDASGFVPEIVAVTQYAGEVRPEVHVHAGRLWVDWIDASGEAAWSERDAAGQWSPIGYEPFAGAEERDYHVRGAIRSRVLQ